MRLNTVEVVRRFIAVYHRHRKSGFSHKEAWALARWVYAC